MFEITKSAVKMSA